MPKILIAFSLVLSLGLSLLGVSPSYATVDPPAVETQQFDVVIYGTTTAGIGTLRGLQMAAARYPKRLRVAVVSSGGNLESPLAQGSGWKTCTARTIPAVSTSSSATASSGTTGSAG